MEYIRGEVCGVENCRATQYYLEDGLWFCKNGHIREVQYVLSLASPLLSLKVIVLYSVLTPLQGRVQVHADDEQFGGGTQGTTTRRQREREEIPARVFEGEKAFELFLQCYQLVLRKQAVWLVERQKVPAELETIIRDLWALRLQNLRLVSDASARLQDEDGGGGERFYSSTSEGGGAQSQDEEERYSDPNLPVLRETLSLCYIGVLLLRLPLSLGDFYRWAIQGDIVYVRAIRSIPRDMRCHLPPEYQFALDHRTTTLRPDELHRDTAKLALYYQKHFGLVLQSINTPLILFRYINDLALPLNTYHAVNKISAILKLSFTFQCSPVKTQNDSFPEAKLMSLLVIAVKVSQCFDPSKCMPRTDAEPAALTIDWNVWVRAFRDSKEDAQSLRRGEEMNVTENDVFRMNGGQLDQYLDWYEKTWAEDGDTILPEALLKLFPTGNRSVSGNDNIEGLQLEDETGPLHSKPEILAEALKVQTAISDEMNEDLARPEGKDQAFKRPGSQYKRYRKVEDIPKHIKPLFEAASSLIAVRLETLVRAVFQSELKLEKWARGEYKRKGVMSAALDGDMTRYNNEEQDQPVEGGDEDHAVML
ncbi:MAG: Pol I core factor CF [Peltula sp. TS41687]|nr:MAG: Pol I core factor CF [Peltula sp. TS41687]